MDAVNIFFFLISELKEKKSVKKKKKRNLPVAAEFHFTDSLMNELN